MQLNKSSRVFSAIAKTRQNGLRIETPTIYASSREMLAAATAYYESVPGASTTDRIARALHLHDVFDAEARHTLT